MSPGSVMPSYDHLLTDDLKFSAIAPLVKAAHWLGAPYTDELEESEALARRQDEEISTDRVKQLPRLFPSPLVALDIIAWSAAAMWRIEAAQRLVQGIPEPERLDEPGWYTEPLFAKAERYWDGRDWTSRVRTSAGEPEIVLEL